jgi:hypothetical protein
VRFCTIFRLYIYAELSGSFYACRSRELQRDSLKKLPGIVTLSTGQFCYDKYFWFILMLIIDVDCFIYAEARTELVRRKPALQPTSEAS